MESAANLFLRRLALPNATKSNQQQLRSLTNLISRSSFGNISSNRNFVTQRNVDVISRGMATISAGEALTRLASDHPHMEIVRYEHKNVKWTLKHVDYYSDALACGFLGTGLKPGDVVLSWLPLNVAEHHILQFACSKAGMLLYHLDPNPELAKTNPDASKAALSKALELTKANVLVQLEAGSDVNYIRLTEGVIPEIRIFDFCEGMPFFTPRYPHLRFPINTGYDIEDKAGMCLYKHFLVPSNNLDTLLANSGSKSLDGKTPLLGELVYGSDGIPVKTGKIMSNEDVFKAKAWPEFTSILSREYKEIPGVGVVF